MESFSVILKVNLMKRASVKYMKSIVTELATTEIRFILKAISLIELSSIVTTRPIIMKSGVPGGWGMPIETEHAINSPQSQNGMVGCTVRKFGIIAAKKVSTAKMLISLLSLLMTAPA
jgi:hypothetical protein